MKNTSHLKSCALFLSTLLCFAPAMAQEREVADESRWLTPASLLIAGGTATFLGAAYRFMRAVNKVPVKTSASALPPAPPRANPLPYIDLGHLLLAGYDAAKATFIGQGSFGAVYSVPVLDASMIAARTRSSLTLGDNVAVKVLKQDRVNSNEEILILQKLSHPNILTIIESGQSAGTLFFVTELLPSDLRKLISRGVFDGLHAPYSSESVVRDLLEAISYLHSQNYIHCDLKPENVLVAADGSIRVADFGETISKGGGSLKQRVVLMIKNRHRVTAVGRDAQGTPIYWPPEILRVWRKYRAQYDCSQVDEWALGLIFLAVSENAETLFDASDIRAAIKIGVTNESDAAKLATALIAAISVKLEISNSRLKPVIAGLLKEKNRDTVETALEKVKKL